MSKTETANAFLRSASASSLDRMGGDAKGAQYRFSVLGTAVGTHTYDQASFFNRLADTVITATTFALATISPSVTRFSSLEVGNYLAFNPAQVRNANITGANSADALASLEIRPTRFDPSGDEQTERIGANSFQTASDFQSTRVQIPLDEIMDGYSFLRVINDAEATAVAYKITFTFGARIDRRLDVPDAGPALITSSSPR